MSYLRLRNPLASLWNDVPMPRLPRYWDEQTESETNLLTSMDVADDGERYVVEVDLPGVDKDSIGIELNNSTLTISSERKIERTSKMLACERAAGTIFRAVRLPADVGRDDIKAKYENGVLRVEIPKDAKAKTRKIEVL